MKIINFNDYSKEPVYEYRTKAGADKKKETFSDEETFSEDDTPVVVAGDVVNANDIDMKDYVGVKANANPSHGVFDVDIPTEQDAVRFDDKKIWSENLENLWDVIASRTNFFIQGEAGWAKTDLITQMAKKCGYHVITVYLDKALPEDLAGLTVTKEYTRPNGTMGVRQEIAMPIWAQYMLDNPDKKFLLFFDELNQTTNDVMKALMPICHPKKRVICGTLFNNYFVGAAGNMDYENDLESIPRPLMARLGGSPISWITGVDANKAKANEAWDDAFDYLHRAWDNKIGKDLVNLFNKHRMIFAAPRDIELNLFESMYNYAQLNKDDKNFYRVSERRFVQKIKSQTRTLEGTQKGYSNGNEYTSTIDDQVKILAKACYEWVMNNVEGDTKRSFKDAEANKDEELTEDNMTNEDVDKLIQLAYGGEATVTDDAGKNVVIPITPEIMQNVFGVTKTMLSVVNSNMKKSGYTWKYPTLADAIATGKWKAEDFE